MEHLSRNRFAELAFEWMKREFDTEFDFVSTFRTDYVTRFLAWIRTIEPAERLHAALAVTDRRLRLQRIISGNPPPVFDYWARAFGSSPLRLSNDQWTPRRQRLRIRKLVEETFGPLVWNGKDSALLPHDNPLAISRIRTALELNTSGGDIVLMQFLEDDDSLIQVSYLPVLGLGQTAWRLRDDLDCERAISQIPGVIKKAGELVI